MLSQCFGYSKAGCFNFTWASPVAQWVKKPPAIGDTWVRSLGWEDALENSMDYTVHGVEKSRTRLSNFHFHLILLNNCYFNDKNVFFYTILPHILRNTNSSQSIFQPNSRR